MDIGFSEIDAIFGEYVSGGQIGPTRFSVENVNFGMPPREELAAQEKFRSV